MSISTDLQKEFCEKRREILARQFYYGDRLETFSKYNRWLEAVLALVTGGTLVGFLGDLAVPTPVLTMLTGVFSIIAFSLSIIKNIWGVNKEVQRYGELYTTYLHISTEHDELVDLVKKNKNVKDMVFREKIAAATRVRKQISDREDINMDIKLAQVKIKDRVDAKLPEEKCVLEHIPTLERLSQTPFVVIKT